MSDLRELRGGHAARGIAEARQALVEWVEGGGAAGRIFLQVHIRADGAGTYSLRHVADQGSSNERLEIVTDPFAAAAIAQTDGRGEHRPLKTAPNLRRGWLISALDARGLWTALDYLYPACANHWNAARQTALRTTHWSDVAARQTGIYGAVDLLRGEPLGRAVRACCADAVCLRTVAWGASPSEPEPLRADGAREPATAQDEPAVVPCPEACSIFIAFARKVIAVERESRQEVPGLGALSDEEIRQLRDVTFAAAAASLDGIREGDFENPLNRRRIRYLAERLAEAG